LIFFFLSVCWFDFCIDTVPKAPKRECKEIMFEKRHNVEAYLFKQADPSYKCQILGNQKLYISYKPQLLHVRFYGNFYPGRSLKLPKWFARSIKSLDFFWLLSSKFSGQWKKVRSLKYQIGRLGWIHVQNKMDII